MGRPDATAAAALDDDILHPCFVGYLDFDGDPVRVTTAPYNVSFSGTGDADLDGYTYLAANPELIQVSDVYHKENGSETVTASLSGLITVDTDLLNIIGDTSKWRGRSAALWVMLYSPSLTRIGNIWRYYTGRMVAAPIRGDTLSQTIEIAIEGYLASLNEASNRTYLDQAYFDSGDLSAELAIAIGNGVSENAFSSGPVSGFAGAGGGRFLNELGEQYR